MTGKDRPGMDVVFDVVGGEVFRQSLKTTRWGARVCVVGFASGERPVIPANYVLIKGLVRLTFPSRTGHTSKLVGLFSNALAIFVGYFGLPSWGERSPGLRPAAQRPSVCCVLRAAC